MPRSLSFAASLSFLCCATAGADVYRCTVDGRSVYSDRPCATGETRQVPVAPGPSADASKAAYLQREASLGRVAVGQTARQVELAWGRPTSVNVDTRPSGKTEQWVYRKGDSDAYVYIENGIVSSMSTHSRDGSAVPAIAAPRVPTQEEREAAERQEKAGERKFVTESQRLSPGAVRAKLGEPNHKSYNGGAETWTYLPTNGDPQTITIVTFAGGWMTSIDRRPHR